MKRDEDLDQLFAKNQESLQLLPGARLIASRQKQGLRHTVDVERACESAGCPVTLARLHKLEKSAMPTFYEADVLCRLLGITLDYWLRGIEDYSSELNRVLESLDDATRETVLALAVANAGVLSDQQ